MKFTHTIYELPPTLFARCKPLYAQAWFDAPVYDAVFEGHQPGRLFVDDAERPTAAMMCRTYDYFIVGETETPLRTFIREAPEEPGVFQKLYGYVPVGDAWKQALLNDIPLQIIPRLNFQWDMRQPAPEIAPPPGSRIQRMDRALAEQADRALPLPFMSFFWDSYDAMVTNGFAYCAQRDDAAGAAGGGAVAGAITSVIYAIAVSSTGVVIGIDTVEQYWRQGYGAAASAAFIREALERGLQPIWDTDGDNERSAQLARKLGFVEHAPFSELRPPEWKLAMTRGVWSQGERAADGIVEWRRQ